MQLLGVISANPSYVWYQYGINLFRRIITSKVGMCGNISLFGHTGRSEVTAYSIFMASSQP